MARCRGSRWHVNCLCTCHSERLHSPSAGDAGGESQGLGTMYGCPLRGLNWRRACHLREPGRQIGTVKVPRGHNQ
jgi:hypothetical protein